MRTHTYVEHGLRLQGKERERAKARLGEIAAELDTAFEREREVSRSIQRLRDEQRELNAKVYRA